MAKERNELRGMIYARYRNASECARALGWQRNKLSVIVTGRKEVSLREAAALAGALGCGLEEMAEVLLK